jgi:hypothetical protein
VRVCTEPSRLLHQSSYHSTPRSESCKQRCYVTLKEIYHTAPCRLMPHINTHKGLWTVNVLLGEVSRRKSRNRMWSGTFSRNWQHYLVLDVWLPAGCEVYCSDNVVLQTCLITFSDIALRSYCNSLRLSYLFRVQSRTLQHIFKKNINNKMKPENYVRDMTADEINRQKFLADFNEIPG